MCVTFAIEFFVCMMNENDMLNLTLLLVPNCRIKQQARFKGLKNVVGNFCGCGGSAKTLVLFHS